MGIKKYNEMFFLGGTVEGLDDIVEVIKSKIPDSIRKDIDYDAFKEDLNKVIIDHFYMSHYKK